MTDYPRKSKVWKRQEVFGKWQNFIGIFVVIILLFAILSGVLKSVFLPSKISKLSWEGRSAFTIVLATQPVSVLVYNPSTKRLTLVKLNDDLYVETGDSKKPLEKLSETAGRGGVDLARVTSTILRVPVSNYVVFSDKQSVDFENFEKVFVGFASLATPVKILSAKLGITDTNIAQKDIFRLWWQVKSLSTQSLNLVNAGGFSEEIVLSNGDKIMGVDDVSLYELFSKYTENQKILEEGVEVEVVNASGGVKDGKLAEDFVLATGARVVDVSFSENPLPNTVIEIGEGSYTASYLAKIFDCDIKSSAGLEKGKIRIILGQDFSQKY